MKTILRSALLIGALVSFASCATPEQPKVEGEGTPVSLFVEGIATKAATDLQATAFSGGEKVGVFVTSGETSVTANNCHTVASDKTTLTPTTQIVYPAEAVNIYAYAPYNAEATTTLPFAVNTDQSVDANYIASDLLYASKEDVTASSNAVGLTFTHKMSKVILKVKANSAITLNGDPVTLKNVATTVSLDLASGVATTTTATDDVVVGAPSAACAALIAPHTFDAGEFVTVGGYTASFSTDFTFEAGKVYTFNVTIDKAATISVASITDWTTGTGQDITIVD